MNSEAVIKEFEKDIRAMLKDIGRVSDKYLNSLVIDGQKNVLFSPENIQLSGEMDAELQRITQKYGKIFERYGKRMIILSKSIMSDFEGMGTKQQLDRSMERVQQMLERVGIQPNGTISPSSFLGTFINAEPLRLEIRKFLQETVATGRSFSSTLTEFNKRFKGDGEMTGKIAGYFRTTIKDMTWEIERTASETFAKTLNLQYFIHDGTLMETSREFCIERAGKVFHVSDVEKWEKNLPYFPENYDYFKHCGGYGCNHRTRWMSNATGAKLYQQKQPQSPTPPPFNSIRRARK